MMYKKKAIVDQEKNGLWQLQLLEQEVNLRYLNQSVIKSLGAPITEYPAGLVNENGEGKKKVLIFSPHPDDDVICMAGTMTKLVKEGLEVHVAYQTSKKILAYSSIMMQ